MFHDLGTQLLKKNSPYLALQCFQKINPNIKLFEIHPFSANEYIYPDIARLKDVELFSERWPLFNKKRINWIQLSARNLNPLPMVEKRISENKRFVLVDKPEATFEIPQTCVFLGGDENFCHWINRYLMRLSLIESYPELKKLPLVVNENLHKFQRETLELLGISEDQLIKVPPNTMIACKDLIVPINVRYTSKLPGACFWLREKLKEYIKTPTDRRIYISRADMVGGRVMFNEKEVLEIFDKYEFERVIPGKLHFKDQVGLFSESTSIAGPHGAGLVNLIFAPKNAFALELSDVVVGHLVDFQEISKAVQLRYINIMSNVIRTLPNTFIHDFHDYIVDTNALETALSEEFNIK